MKKYITAAALFAAGTALSGAATVITLTDMSQNVSGDISYDAETGYLTGGSMFTTVSTRHSASTTLNLDLTALGAAEDGSSFSGATTQLLQYQISAADTNGAIGLAATQYGVQFTWNGALWSTSESTFISWETLRESSYDKEGNSYVVLTLVAPCRTGGDGSQVFNSDGGDFKWTDTSGRTGVGFGYKSLTSSNAYETIYVNTDYVSAVSVFSGIATASEIAAASQLVIPEPSAFGLLAGAGALALVASRRRRAK